MRSLRTAVALSLALSLGGSALATDADVRREVARALALKEPGERIDGVQAALRGADGPEAAEAVIETVLVPDAPQALLDVGVRALGRMTSPGALGVLSDAVVKAKRDRALLLAEALGRSSGEVTREILRTLTVRDDVRVRAAAVTALGDRREEEGAGGLAAALEDPEWTVRSAAIRGLRVLGGATAQALLAERVGREEGRLADDLAAALAQTGLPKGATLPAAGTPSFRSPLVTIRSRRVLFVLSTSETMKDAVHRGDEEPAVLTGLRAAGKDLADDYVAAQTKLDLARVHLRAMLRTLADGVVFDVLISGSSVTAAFGDPTVADDASRRKAEARIARLSPGGVPDVQGLVQRIFDPRSKGPIDAPDSYDTVVLFSDGALPTGRFDDRTELAPRAVRWNRARQIRFVVVAAGQAEPYLLGALAGGPPPGLSLSIP